MPITQHHVWHVQIHPGGPGSVMAEIHKFRDSGFSVTGLPELPSWRYSLHHSNSSAMTLHTLREDCANFTVTASPDV
jgi:hypothetical protein